MANIHNPLPEQFRASKEELQAYRERVTQYLTSMCLVKQMYREGIIDKADYAMCEEKMAEKYGLPDISIYRKSDPDDPKSFIKVKPKES